MPTATVGAQRKSRNPANGGGHRRDHFFLLLPLPTATATSSSAALTSHMDITKLSNIGPLQRRRRLVYGLVALVAGLALALALVTNDIPRWWRLALWFPFTAAAIGLLQAYHKT